MWWILLRLLGVRDTIGLLLRVAQILVLGATAILAAYALGFDPVQFVWNLFVDVVQAAVEEAVGNQLP